MPSKSVLALEWPVFRPRGWGTPTNARELPRPWWGLDTERDAKDGRFVCGYAVGETTLQFENMRSLPAGTYWVWNLAYDIEGMLRDLDVPEGWAAKKDGAQFELEGGRAVYYHGKRFDWRGPNGPVSFLEASSFFGRRPLREMGAKEGVDASKMSLERYRNDAEYRAEVDSYCKQDARIVYDAVVELGLGVGALGVSLGATPGATARRFLTRLGAMPRVIWGTHTGFLRSYCGGRFEVTKRGVLKDVMQYDIVSAYPWALSKCPWLTDTATAQNVRRLNDGALYGSYEVSFETDEYLGIAPRWNRGVRVYSNAQEKTWLSRPEVEWLQGAGYDVRVHRGVEISDENATDLWAQVIGGLFEMKRSKKGQPEGMGAKILLNSMYGVLIQLVQKSGKWVPLEECKNPVDFAGMLALEAPPRAFEGGKYYAPVYASNLTALTRVKLLEAARSVGEEAYIGGHTDSVLTTRPLNIDLGGHLGGWELEKSAERADICKTGMYALGGKVKMRGITRAGTAEILWADTHERNTRAGIKRARSWDEVSVITPKTVANNYTIENKRRWRGEFTRGTVEREEYIDSDALRWCP